MFSNADPEIRDLNKLNNPNLSNQNPMAKKPTTANEDTVSERGESIGNARRSIDSEYANRYENSMANENELGL